MLTWRALRAAGVSEARARGILSELRSLHRGVHVTGHGPITPRQRQLAATLTSSDSVLSHASAAALHGFGPAPVAFEVVTRPGSGGPCRIGSLLICRSRRLASETMVVEGVPVTTAARTLVDLAPHLPPPLLAKLVREARRLRCVTADELDRAIVAHRGRRGVARLAAVVGPLRDLPLHRVRSDAEARALEILAEHGVAPPAVNVRISGEEADLSWPATRRIVEIDGPQFHRDPREDARKTQRWVDAGWEVQRIGSAAVFETPGALVALARA